METTSEHMALVRVELPKGVIAHTEAEFSVNQINNTTILTLSARSNESTEDAIRKIEEALNALEDAFDATNN